MSKQEKMKPPINYAFESPNQRYEFTKICRDMMKSKAWDELNLRQKRIISTFKIKIYSK